jgi:hypothetical protein
MGWFLRYIPSLKTLFRFGFLDGLDDPSYDTVKVAAI